MQIPQYYCPKHNFVNSQELPAFPAAPFSVLGCALDPYDSEQGSDTNRASSVSGTLL